MIMTTTTFSGDYGDAISVCFVVAVMDDSVSVFIAGTCRIIQKLEADVFQSIHSQSTTSGERYKIVCGSSAEFFIQPLHSCIDDIDELELMGHHLVFRASITRRYASYC